MNPNVKQLRRIAHHLQPVVMVGEGGATDQAARELDRALTDHELVKVRLHVDDRAARGAAIDHLCAMTEATLVQRIGKVAVLYRVNAAAKPALSNVQRYG